MPILALVSILLQISCAVHVVRSGRPLYWIWILIIGSYLAVIVYAIVAVIPDLRNDPRGHQVARKVIDTIDPARRRREIEARLEVADTIQNRHALAEECLRNGDWSNAAELYRSILTGLYVTDSTFLLGLAEAQAGMEDFAAALATLDTLAEANPDFHSHEADLFRARCLDALGNVPEAMAAYAALAENYPGEEGRFRYGEFLKRQNDRGAARRIFEGMLKRARTAPKHYRRKERAWLDEARRELAALGPE
jgi:hypothetical protein